MASLVCCLPLSSDRFPDLADSLGKRSMLTYNFRRRHDRIHPHTLYAPERGILRTARIVRRFRRMRRGFNSRWHEPGLV